MEQIIQFLKNQFRDGFFNGKLLNTKDISDPIVRAINEKEGVESVSITNTEDFTSKIVEEQKKTTEAISKIVIPEQKDVDFSNLSAKIDELKSVLEKKELSVSVGETKVEVDTKGIISSVERLQQAVEGSKTILKPQEVIDYTSFLEEIIKNVERPDYDFSKIEEILSKIEKKEFVLPLDENGRVKVSIDRILGSSGSRALSTAQETVLRGIATQEKQDPTAPYSISDLDESGTTKYYGFLKDDGGWYIMSVTSTAVRYVKGTSGYSFASPSSLTYDTFSNTF